MDRGFDEIRRRTKPRFRLLRNSGFLARLRDMRTLNIAISDVEYNQFGFTSQELIFSDFVDQVSKTLMKRNLDAADRYGLSSMTEYIGRHKPD